MLTPKIKGKFSPCIDDRKLHLTCFEQPAHSVTPLPLALLSLKGRISQHLDRLFSYCNSVFCALFLKRTPLQPLLGPLNTLTPLLILHFKPVFYRLEIFTACPLCESIILDAGPSMSSQHGVERGPAAQS